MRAVADCKHVQNLASERIIEIHETATWPQCSAVVYAYMPGDLQSDDAQTFSSSLEIVDTIQMDYPAEFAYAGASNLETNGPCAHSKIGKVKHPSEAVESNVCFLWRVILRIDENGLFLS